MGSYAGTYHVPLVVLSVVVAIFASFTALHLGSRVSETRGAAHRLWLLCGALAMGLGIWSMHFIAMLAFSLPVTITYDPQIVVLSVLPAIVASALGLHLASRRQRLTWQDLTLGGLLMGVGIVSMHYSGMAAMVMPAHLQYDPLLIAASCAIAVGASVTAMFLIYFFREEAHDLAYWSRKIGSAVVMGFAIAGMHYTGMSAAHFHPLAEGAAGSVGGLNNTLLAITTAVASLLLMGMAMIGALVDRRLATQSSKLQHSEQRYLSLFEHNPDAVFTLNRAGQFIEANPAAEKMLGHRADALLQMNIMPFLSPDDLEQAMAHYHQVLEGIPQNFEIKLLAADKSIDVSITGVPMHLEDEIGGLYVIAQDITERKRSEQAINHMAYHDDLTGLPNRRLFIDRLHRAIRAGQHAGTRFAVLFLDMDRFKNYNDSLGHLFGDDLLKSISERLLACAPERSVVARLSGDEFTLLLETASREEAAATAERLLAAVSSPYLIKGHEIRITSSIGISLFPDNGSDAATLLKNADAAMYSSKERGNTYQFYEASMNTEAYDRLMLENDMRKAIEREEFLVHYQPQFNIRTQTFDGVEALVRWQHPEQGLISPARFIPLAEENGLIVPIGEYVLRSACRQAVRWLEAGLPPLRMAVNLSTRQFQHHDLVQTVMQVLNETGLPPELLELEVTESMTLDVRRAQEVFSRLKEIGVGIGIDDFGTGYSSLSYLKSFPIDRLKIDQSFVRDIENDKNNAAIISTIISMAQNLDLKVIAEGVETDEHLRFLRENGCDEAQGYLFARPLPAEELEAYVRERAATGTLL